MNNKKWTQGQFNAINAKGGSLLVSAAAGSGKTAVLVQRVINKITNETDPVDIDRLLIVTFTKAAALQMKEKISQKLLELIRKDPKNKRLKRQQMLLGSAKISTVHGFCSEIVKENFYKLGISSDFRIASEGETTLIKDEAIQNTLDKLYEKSDVKFYKLVEMISSVKDDRKLIKAIYDIYDFTRSCPFPQKWMDEKLSLYNEKSDLSKTIWHKKIFTYAFLAVECAINLTNDAINLLLENEDIKKAYIETFYEDLNLLKELKELIYSKEFSKIQKKVKNIKFTALKRLKGYNEDPIKNRICEMRKQVKNIILTKLQKLFIADENSCLKDISEIHEILSELFYAVGLFEEEINKIKKAKNVIDFSDLEHLTLKLLVKNENNILKRTSDAENLSKNFVQVMVDEYQDTNEIQDIIFRAISQKEENLFVVGDVKQSIYGFRQARPEIFLNKKEALMPYNKDENKYPCKIILDKNFRSRKGILDFVNFVFSQLITKQTCKMEYTKEEQLKYGAKYKSKTTPDVNIDILDICDTDEDVDVIEAYRIAEIINNKIHSGQMVKDKDGFRKVTYRDFAVLIRSANNHAFNYAKELNLLGVPAYSDTAESFFKTKEISTMLSLLRIIDNPIQDIPLISVLLSPIFGFEPDDLAKIRLKDKKSPMYFLIKSEAEFGNKKCEAFIKEINDYRRIAAATKTDELINYIYEKTGYTSMVQVMNKGELRLLNLRLLFSYAKEYETFGSGRLTGFIGYIDKLQKQNEDMTPATPLSENSNVVRIMSIHRSKGLEFPICILAGCCRKFNKERADMVIHSSLGVGIRIKDEETMVKYSNIALEAILNEIEDEEMAEELRVLYVALTRGKEELFIINSLKDVKKSVCKAAFKITNGKKIPDYFIKNASSFSDWLLMCILRHPFGSNLRSLANINNDVVFDAKEEIKINILKGKGIKLKKEKKELNKNIIAIDKKFLKKLNNRLNFEYSASKLHNIPSKVSASGFTENKDYIQDNYVKTVPAFIKQQKISAIDKGVALHLFLQFADYKSAKKDLTKEINRLKQKGFLSQVQAKSINLKDIKSFFESDILKRLVKSQKVLKEYRFNAILRAKDIDKSINKEFEDEKVILQGAVDCIFVEEDELVIVDYKTDKLSNSEEIINKYKNQLKLYKYGVEQCTGKHVKECLIYSFYMKKSLKVEI